MMSTRSINFSASSNNHIFLIYISGYYEYFIVSNYFTMREKKKRTPKENVDGRSTSSHDNKKFRARSMEKQKGMAFGFRKTATAVKNIG